MSRIVVKLGSSSVTRPDGSLDTETIERVASEAAAVVAAGAEIIVVSSGAVAAGWAVVGEGAERPSEVVVLQAVSAVGQHRLMAAWSEAFAAHGLLVGQVLLAPNDFADRQQYLQGRETLDRLLGLGVVPVVNENDAVADDELRFGDNDRLAALVAQMVGAERLLILTDAPGLLTADPRIDEDATLIEEVAEFDRSLEEAAGGPGSKVGSGGMASKLAAARLATWSGVETVIAAAREPGVLAAVMAGERATGTTFRPRESSLSARKLWIAFARGAAGRLSIDAGAVEAIVRSGSSLLGQGIAAVVGDFEAGDAGEVFGPEGALVAKGLVQLRSAELESGVEGVVIHRDDLAVLVGSGQGRS